MGKGAMNWKGSREGMGGLRGSKGKRKWCNYIISSKNKRRKF